MDSFINYVDAMAPYIEPTPVATQHLTFMTRQQTIAPDANLADRIQFLTYAIHLNEFLYTHNALISGVPWTAKWRFDIGKAHCSCLPYALLYWILQLGQYLIKEMDRVLLPTDGAVIVGRVHLLTLSPKLVNQYRSQIASVCGMITYMKRVIDSRSLKWVNEQMTVEYASLQSLSPILDLYYGWLALRCLHISYLTESDTSVNTSLFRYAVSCETLTAAHMKEQGLQGLVHHNAKAIAYWAHGYYLYYEGKRNDAVVHWQTASRLGIAMDRPEQTEAAAARVRTEAEDGGGDQDDEDDELEQDEETARRRKRTKEELRRVEASTQLSTDVIDRAVDLLHTFCSRGQDPLQIDLSGFRLKNELGSLQK
jgi:hypothetical protein